MDNFFDDLPDETLPQERFDTLARLAGARIERILSTGQADPEDQWQCQPHDEWVMLVAGTAGLVLRDPDGALRNLELSPGDHLLIPAGQPHRVSHTSDPALWLAVHAGETD